MNNNEYYIEKYKNTDTIIKKYYSNNDIIVDDIINPIDIDLRSICAPTDQQDNKPHCAAYSICNIFESYYWKMTGKLINLDADQVYAKAKEEDYNKNSPGISLEQAIKSCWKLCGFKEDVNIKIINNQCNNIIEKIKFLNHKYGLIHLGLKITDEWYNCINKKEWYNCFTKDKYIIKEGGQKIGQHAVVGCGYNEEGFIIQNSWGKEFGLKGFCIIPYNEFLNEFKYCCYIDNNI